MNKLNLAIRLLVMLIVFCTAANAKAEKSEDDEVSFEQFQQLNRGIGIDIEKSKTNTTTKISQTLHEEKLTDIIKWLQGAGIMNPDITQTAINLMPASLSSVVSLNIATTTVMELYKNDKGADAAHFVAQLNRADEYGNDQIHELFSFDFSRAAFNKVNWDKMSPVNLPKIVKNFHYSKWLMKIMRDEMQR